MTQAAIKAETADISERLRHLTREDRHWLDGVIVGLAMARANEQERQMAEPSRAEHPST